MGRSVAVVIVGWWSGFLIAVAWGATRANNTRLASTLSGWAIAGMVVTGLLLLSIALNERAKRRRVAKEKDRLTPLPAASASATATAAAAASERRAAARIAELETLLAREQEELAAAASSLAATALTATGHSRPETVDPLPDPVAADMEPVLREEVVETVAQLIAQTGPRQPAALAEEVEALHEKVR